MVLSKSKFYNDPLGVTKQKLTYIKYKYDVLLLYKNLDNQHCNTKAGHITIFVNEMGTFLMPFEDRFFPGPISQAIVNLNYLHHSAVFADTIFAHLEFIQRGFWYVMHSWKTQAWTLATHSRSYAENAKFVKGFCSLLTFSGYIAAWRCTVESNMHNRACIVHNSPTQNRNWLHSGNKLLLWISPYWYHE